VSRPSARPPTKRRVLFGGGADGEAAVRACSKATRRGDCAELN